MAQGKKPPPDAAVAASRASARAASSIAAGKAHKSSSRNSKISQDFPAANPERRKLACIDQEAFNEGIDSDGNAPYYYDYEIESDDDTADTEELSESESDSESEDEEKGGGTPSPVTEEKLTAELIANWKQSVLKEACKVRGLAVWGTKDELKERLLTEGKDAKVGDTKRKRKDNPMCGLPKTAYWELLTPDPTPIPEPRNSDPSLRPPSELEAEKVNPRFGYSEKFDRFPFDGTTEHLPIPATRKVRPFI